MKQNEFFNILMDGLKDFPETKLQDIISYYETKINLGLASGKTEEEIITELDNPNLIVKKYRNENHDVNDKTFAEVQNTSTDNNCNNIYSDYSNNNFNSTNDTETSSVITMKSTDAKTNDSYETSSLNDNFYDLYNSNAPSNNQKDTYQTSRSNEENFNLNTESNCNYNSSNNNSNFNNGQNSDNFSNNFNNITSNNKSSHYNVNTILKFCIVGLALIIFFPVITGIIGFILGLLGVAISILVGSIGLLIGGTFTSFAGLPNVPMFIANFPYPVIVLFSLGSISLSILLTLLFYYLCKFFIRISIKVYKSLKSKGGAF